MEQIVTFITSRISPERIVLFGSYARGENRENSDIDIPNHSFNFCTDIRFIF
ncbi:MAG: nucleotidyltransferase domain-containing protein [Planctomycetaceae bacterium]|nr:nucleotidyltransferase domain-containing protein [Planctomycetaceae bacterium]